MLAAAGHPRGDNPPADELYSQHSLAFVNHLNRMAEAAKSALPMTAQSMSDDASDQDNRQGMSAVNSNKTVKASGTFFPQAGKPEGRPSYGWYL